MKRKAEGWWRGAARYDVTKDFEPAQLQGIGAACMAFNMLEGALDFIVARSIGLPTGSDHLLVHRLGGIENKLEFVKAVAGDSLGLPKDVWEETLANVKQCKGYRDAVVHARIVDAPLAVGETRHKQKVEHVLLTAPALSALYERIVAVHNEMAALHFVIQAKHDWRQAQLWGATTELMNDKVAAFLSAHERLQKDRSKRRSLKALPPVPRAPSVELEPHV